MLSFGEWRVFVRIVPQGGLIPINDLFLPDGVTVRKEYLYPWREIWTLLGRQDTASLVLDFLDGDAVPRVGSREDESFPNRSVSDLSELLHLPEIDRRSEEHTSELQSLCNLVCRLLLEKKK